MPCCPKVVLQPHDRSLQTRDWDIEYLPEKPCEKISKLDSTRIIETTVNKSWRQTQSSGGWQTHTKEGLPLQLDHAKEQTMNPGPSTTEETEQWQQTLLPRDHQDKDLKGRTGNGHGAVIQHHIGIALFHFPRWFWDCQPSPEGWERMEKILELFVNHLFKKIV